MSSDDQNEITVTVDDDLMERLKLHVKQDSGLSNSSLVRRALRKHLDSLETLEENEKSD